MKIKTTLRYHLTLVRRVNIKKSINKWGKGCEEKEPSYNDGGNVNWCSH